MAEDTSTSEAYPSSAFKKFTCLLSNAPATRETVAKADVFDAYLPRNRINYSADNIYLRLGHNEEIMLSTP